MQSPKNERWSRERVPFTTVCAIPRRTSDAPDMHNPGEELEAACPTHINLIMPQSMHRSLLRRRSAVCRVTGSPVARLLLRHALLSRSRIMNKLFSRMSINTCYCAQVLFLHGLISVTAIIYLSFFCFETNERNTSFIPRTRVSKSYGSNKWCTSTTFLQNTGTSLVTRILQELIPR